MKSINKLAKVIATVGVTGMTMASSAFASSAVESVFPKNGILSDSLDVQSIIDLVFRILLAVAVLWVVYNIVLAGIKIAGAKDDADKRKNGLKSIINAALGLVVALAALPIVNTVQKQITGTPGAGAQVGLPCKYRSGDIIKIGVKTSAGCTDENGAPQPEVQ
jgi:amino acid transporter